VTQGQGPEPPRKRPRAAGPGQVPTVAADAPDAVTSAASATDRAPADDSVAPHRAQFLSATAQRVADAILQGDVANKAALHQLKQRLSRQSGHDLPRDSDLLQALGPGIDRRVLAMLRKKPTRSMSGVAVVAVMTSPEACPHGKCVYCPGGPDVGVPQSYTGFEPSTMRAIQHGYDPYRIVRNRLYQLDINGHEIDKLEVVLQGGTFPARPRADQDGVVARIYAAANDGPAQHPQPWRLGAAFDAAGDDGRRSRLRGLQEANEQAACRVIGLTVETKPDWCLSEHIDVMLDHGVTRVELGIQTLDEDVLRLTHRGHTLEHTRQAMQAAKDAGLKVCAHMMPGQPRRHPDGTLHPDPEADLDDMRRLFAEEDWRPDMLKIYPTLVVEEGETVLKKWWREGRFHALTATQAADIIAAGKAHVPEWCRIQRVDRDIPTTHVLAGVEKSNLRQLVQERLAEQERTCRCIRCREVGQREREGKTVKEEGIELVRRDYQASGATEVFLSLEHAEADAIMGFLRLRRLGNPHRPELAGAAMVRELRVYGTALGLGDDPEAGTHQHRGHGARLLQEAERIAFEEWGAARLAVIAGIGVKGYYRRHGYTDLGPYVAKSATEAAR
jgi:elongator complex protein 3